MPSDAAAAQVVLRALAEARDELLHALYVTQPAESRSTIDFRIFKVADSEDTRVVAAISTLGRDGRERCSSVSVTTSSSVFLIEGSVEIDDDQGNWNEIFHTDAQTGSAVDAAALVRKTTIEVCQQGMEPLSEAN